MIFNKKMKKKYKRNYYFLNLLKLSNKKTKTNTRLIKIKKKIIKT